MTTSEEIKYSTANQFITSISLTSMSVETTTTTTPRTSSVETAATSTIETSTFSTKENGVVSTYKTNLPYSTNHIIILSTVIPIVWIAFVIVLIWIKKSGSTSCIINTSNSSRNDKPSNSYELSNVSNA